MEHLYMIETIICTNCHARGRLYTKGFTMENLLLEWMIQAHKEHDSLKKRDTMTITQQIDIKGT